MIIIVRSYHTIIYKEIVICNVNCEHELTMKFIEKGQKWGITIFFKKWSDQGASW